MSIQLVRGYELHEQIGVGGFGEVYRAFQPVLGREVAIKFILPIYANQPDFIRHFEQEAQLVARLEHPHIVPLYDYWREPDGTYLVMRWIRGGNLRQKLEDGGWDTERTVQLVHQLSSALHLAHRSGVVHCDVKPDNILIDDDGNAYLTDFGIARVIGRKRTSDTQGISGSISYIAPEQLKGETIGPQTDMYALALVIYETLTGKYIFEGDSISEIVNKHLHELIPNICDVCPELPNALNNMLQRATAKDPADRFPDIRAMSHAFQQAVSSATLPRTEEVIDLNPYKGLCAFEQADADFFFGRESLTQQLIERLGEIHNAQRFLAVVGPSGSGKSSAVKAGLLPALRKGSLPGSAKWFMVEMVPGEAPLRNLETALSSVARTPPVNLYDMLKAERHGLLWAADRILGDLGSEMLLLIDQFEELFTLTEDEQVRNHFLELLVTATNTPSSRVRIVVTLRADFYDRPLLYGAFGELMQMRTHVVLPLDADEIEHAIDKPAQQVGLQVEPELVAAIIADVEKEPGALPLLQYALSELYERREGTRLTLAAYQASGGVKGAVARRAEEVYKELTPAQQKIARQIFLRLLTLGEGVEDTRRRARRTEFSALGTSDELNAIFDAFGKHRLLTFDREAGTRAPMVEVAHEALIHSWKQLHDWLEASRNDLRLERMLSSAAAEWRQNGFKSDYLLRGAQLAQYEGWVETSSIGLTSEENNYLLASIAEHKKQQAQEDARKARETALERRSRSRLRSLVVVLMMATVISLGLTAFAVSRSQSEQQARALADRRAAEAESVLAVEDAQFIGGRFPFIGYVLALDALQLSNPPARAENRFASIFYDLGPRRVMVGHEAPVLSVAYSPDGQYGLSGSADTTLRLWDMQTGNTLRVFTGHTDVVTSVAFSPDGQYVVSGSADGTIILWNSSTGDIVRPFLGHEDAVLCVDYSKDGTYIVSGSADTTLILWNVATGEILHRLTGHSSAVVSTAFSWDSTTIASGGGEDDYTIHLWDVESGEILRTLSGHQGTVTDVSFHPDGTMLVSSSEDQTLILWYLDEEDSPPFGLGVNWQILLGHRDLVYTAAFSPDGRYVVSGSEDDRLLVWDVDPLSPSFGQAIRVLTGHNTLITSAAFSPDGRQILSGSDDMTLILWDAASGAQVQAFLGHVGVVNAVALSVDGRTALSGAHDDRMVLWDIATGEELHSFEGHENNVRAVAASPDGRYALSGSQDQTLILWDLTTGVELRTFQGHEGTIRAATFSPDGRHIASGGEDLDIFLWEVDTGTLVRRFVGHERTVNSIMFSPDGSQILSSSNDRTMRLWNTVTGEQIQAFVGHVGQVYDADFDPDGIHALSSGADERLIFWDLATGQALHTFYGHVGEVYNAAFSPDGHFAASGGRDGFVILWDTDPTSPSFGEPLRTYVGHTETVRSIAFSASGEYILSGGWDNRIFLWRVDTLDELFIWIWQNRYVPELTCEERVLYEVIPLCDSNNTFSTRTPYPTP